MPSTHRQAKQRVAPLSEAATAALALGLAQLPAPGGGSGCGPAYRALQEAVQEAILLTQHLVLLGTPAYLASNPSWHSLAGRPWASSLTSLSLNFFVGITGTVRVPALQGSWKDFKRSAWGASLVAQWLRSCLPMQGTRVRALVWEDPTCRGATRPVSHNY